MRRFVNIDFLCSRGVAAREVFVYRMVILFYDFFCHVGKWLVYNGNRNKHMMEVKIMNNMDIDKKVISDSELQYVTGGVGMETILNRTCR